MDTSNVATFTLQGRVIAQVMTQEIIFLGIFIVIMARLWERFAENLIFGTLGLDRTAAFVSVVMAVALLIIFLAIDASIGVGDPEVLEEQFR